MASKEDSGTEILQLASHREVLKILECPVCLEVPFPPIYNCRGGHTICHVCRPRLTNCVLCKDEFSEGRNFVAESIVLSSKHSCRFKGNGCDVELDGYSISEHFKTCRYKNGALPKKIVPTVISLANSKAHIATPHTETPTPVSRISTPSFNNSKRLESQMVFQAEPEPSSKSGLYSKWTHEKLKFTIETSPSRESVEECRAELRRRIMSGWAGVQKSNSVALFSRKAEPKAGASIPKVWANFQSQKCSQVGNNVTTIFKPSAPPLALTQEKETFVRIPLPNTIGFWYAHFRGEYVIRQMELRRQTQPILLSVGDESMDKMFELKLSESGFLEDPEASVPRTLFEQEWKRHGGKS